MVSIVPLLLWCCFIYGLNIKTLVLAVFRAGKNGAPRHRASPAMRDFKARATMKDTVAVKNQREYLPTPCAGEPDACRIILNHPLKTPAICFITNQMYCFFLVSPRLG